MTEKYVNAICSKNGKSYYIKQTDYNENIKNNGKYISNEILLKTIKENIDKKYINDSYFDDDNIEKSSSYKSYILGLIINNIDEYNIKKEYLKFSLTNSLNSNIELELQYVISEYDFYNNKHNYIIKSPKILKSICSKLNILDNNYNNFDIKYFIKNNDDENNIMFIRAYIESNCTINIDSTYNLCDIKFNSVEEILLISKKINVPSYKIIKKDNYNHLIYNDVNVIDFMGIIYKNDINFIYNKFLYHNYLYILNNIKCNELPFVKVYKTINDAVIPNKCRESDVGYDITIINKVKSFNDKTTLYDTGIKVSIPNGYYIEIVPRSSLSKSGYMLSNSVGIIDQSYRGNIFISLTKIDENSPEIELPFRCCQMIIKKQIYVNMMHVTDDFEKTSRNDGCFGST